MQYEESRNLNDIIGYMRIAGFVLAGGASARMGPDKELTPAGGRLTIHAPGDWRRFPEGR